MENLKAIPTKYKGYSMRSRLEARWAVFFDAFSIKWEYEPEGYSLSTGPYLPDFYLPEASDASDGIGVFVEVKPIEPNEQESTKARSLVLESGKPLIFCVGVPEIKTYKLCHAMFNNPEYYFVDDGYVFGDTRRLKFPDGRVDYRSGVFPSYDIWPMGPRTPDFNRNYELAIHASRVNNF